MSKSVNLEVLILQLRTLFWPSYNTMALKLGQNEVRSWNFAVQTCCWPIVSVDREVRIFQLLTSFWPSPTTIALCSPEMLGRLRENLSDFARNVFRNWELLYQDVTWNRSILSIIVQILWKSEHISRWNRLSFPASALVKFGTIKKRVWHVAKMEICAVENGRKEETAHLWQPKIEL
jgi:hypothetical protein